MRLLVNGTETEVDDGQAVADLVGRLGFAESRGIAVAVDGEVVARSRWFDRKLEDGQRVEIVRAVQGG